MNIHLADHGSSRGPFSEEQVQGMLAAGSIAPTILAWREGEADWKPLSEFGLGASPLLPPPLPSAPGQKSALGMISLVCGILFIFVWVGVFGVAGVMGRQGKADENFTMILGLFMIAGLFLNLVAMILGIVGTATSRQKAVSLTGALLNAALIAGVILLVLIGLAVKG